MAATEFEQSHKITYYETDVTDRLTVAMLVNLLVLISDEQSISLGLDTDVVQAHGVGWVVTQYHLTINQLPRTNDVVTLRTRATSYNKYFAYRESWLFDDRGQECAHIEGLWVTMSYATRKMTAIPEDIIQPYQAAPVKLTPRLPRPTRLADDQITVQEAYHVRYFDIDGNGHVNNAHYFDWMLDPLPAEFLKTHQPVSLDIRFENEVHGGHLVTSEVGMDADAMKTQHVIMDGAQVAAFANIDWQTWADDSAS